MRAFTPSDASMEVNTKCPPYCLLIAEELHTAQNTLKKKLSSVEIMFGSYFYGS